jgi:glycine betaine/proline transport system ATP-binding protein
MAQPGTSLRRVMAALTGEPGEDKGEVVVTDQGRLLGRIGPREIVEALGRHQAKGG